MIFSKTSTKIATCLNRLIMAGKKQSLLNTELESQLRKHIEREENTTQALREHVDGCAEKALRNAERLAKIESTLVTMESDMKRGTEKFDGLSKDMADLRKDMSDGIGRVEKTLGALDGFADRTIAQETAIQSNDTRLNTIDKKIGDVEASLSELKIATNRNTEEREEAERKADVWKNRIWDRLFWILGTPVVLGAVGFLSHALGAGKLFGGD